MINASQPARRARFLRWPSNVPAVLLIYQWALASAGLILFAAFLLSRMNVGNAWAVSGLALAAAFAERGRVRLVGVIEVSISLLPTVFAAAVFGPLAAMLVAGASFLADLPLLMPPQRRSTAAQQGFPYLKWGIYTSTRAITGAAAGLVALGAGALDAQSAAQIATATAGAALTAEVLDMAFGALTLRLRGGEAGDLVKTMVPVIFGYVSLYAPVVALLGIAYKEVSPWTLPLFFVPALAAQRLFGLYQQQRRLADDLGAANAQLEAANLSFATALVATLDARDRYTAGHSAAVAIYARDIAKRMSLSSDVQRLAHLAGLVHDIGKIGLPAGLLEKSGALTLEERRHMERHSIIGARILAKVDTYMEVAEVVKHHHERIDGQGYPDGLLGDEIPVLSRIIAVADAYNAMTSDRPYRDAMPSRVARLRLAQAVDSQFDTTVVAAFEAVLAGASEDYRLARTDDFQFGLPDRPDDRDISKFVPVERLTALHAYS